MHLQNRLKEWDMQSRNSHTDSHYNVEMATSRVSQTHRESDKNSLDEKSMIATHYDRHKTSDDSYIGHQEHDVNVNGDVKHAEGKWKDDGVNPRVIYNTDFNNPLHHN